VQLSREEARARLASIPLAVGLLFSEAGPTGSSSSASSSAASPSSGDGVVVTAVKDGQAACLAGLRVGDVLLSLRGHSTSSKAAFLSSLRGARVGDRVPVHLRREGESIQLELTLGGRGCTEQEIEALRRQAGLE
jgi:S1-C subfamily serine protease